MASGTGGRVLGRLHEVEGAHGARVTELLDGKAGVCRCEERQLRAGVGQELSHLRVSLHAACTVSLRLVALQSQSRHVSEWNGRARRVSMAL